MAVSPLAMSDPKAEVRMSVDGEAAGSRLPRSGLSPRPRVRLRSIADHEYNEDVLCGECNKYHLADLYIHASGACSRVDFRPVGGAAFVSTHPYDDSAAIATLAARNGPVATGPSRADAFYQPARTVDPTDLGI